MAKQLTEYEKAKKVVEAKKGFYAHLTSFVATMIFFIVINLSTSPEHLWFYWPMLGWGIGLASHYVGVFGIPGIGALDKSWEQREIQKELEKRGTDMSDFEEEYDDFELRPIEKVKNKKWSDSDLV